MVDAPVGRDPALQELLDKQAISEATMRYCRGVDRGDPDLVNSAYHPDAVDDHEGKVFEGHAVGPGLVAWMDEVMVQTSHQITTQTIEIVGDAAACESYYIGAHVSKMLGEPFKMMTAGRYVDRFDRRGGEWKIATRLVVVDSRIDLPLGDASSLGRLCRRDRSDPSYAVFDALRA